MNLDDQVVKVSKGSHFDQDTYSAFDDTGLATYLRRHKVERIWIGGLALDVCVRATALDANQEGFEVHLIPSAVRAVDEVNGEEALNEMKDAGVIIN